MSDDMKVTKKLFGTGIPEESGSSKDSNTIDINDPMGRNNGIINQDGKDISFADKKGNYSIIDGELDYKNMTKIKGSKDEREGIYINEYGVAYELIKTKEDRIKPLTKREKNKKNFVAKYVIDNKIYKLKRRPELSNFELAKTDAASQKIKDLKEERLKARMEYTRAQMDAEEEEKSKSDKIADLLNKNNMMSYSEAELIVEQGINNLKNDAQEKLREAEKLSLDVKKAMVEKQQTQDDEVEKDELYTYAKAGETAARTAERLGFKRGTKEFKEFMDANKDQLGGHNWFKVGQKIIIPDSLRDKVNTSELMTDDEGQAEVTKHRRNLFLKRQQAKAEAARAAQETQQAEETEELSIEETDENEEVGDVEDSEDVNDEGEGIDGEEGVDGTEADAKEVEQPQERGFWSRIWHNEDRNDVVGEDDGKIGFIEASKSFIKGATIGVAKDIAEHPIAAGATVLGLGALAAISAPVAGVVTLGLAGVGLLSGVVGIVKGADKVSLAKTDKEDKEGWEEIGNGAMTTGLSYLMGKAALKPVKEAAKAASETQGVWPKIKAFVKGEKQMTSPAKPQVKESTLKGHLGNKKGVIRSFMKNKNADFDKAVYLDKNGNYVLRKNYFNDPNDPLLKDYLKQYNDISKQLKSMQKPSLWTRIKNWFKGDDTQTQQVQKKSKTLKNGKKQKIKNIGKTGKSQKVRNNGNINNNKKRFKIGKKKNGKQVKNPTNPNVSWNQHQIQGSMRNMRGQWKTWTNDGKVPEFPVNNKPNAYFDVSRNGSLKPKAGAFKDITDPDFVAFVDKYNATRRNLIKTYGKNVRIQAEQSGPPVKPTNGKGSVKRSGKTHKRGKLGKQKNNGGKPVNNNPQQKTPKLKNLQKSLNTMQKELPTYTKNNKRVSIHDAVFRDKNGVLKPNPKIITDLKDPAVIDFMSRLNDLDKKMPIKTKINLSKTSVPKPPTTKQPYDPKVAQQKLAQLKQNRSKYTGRQLAKYDEFIKNVEIHIEKKQIESQIQSVCQKFKNYKLNGTDFKMSTDLVHTASGYQAKTGVFNETLSEFQNALKQFNTLMSELKSKNTAYPNSEMFYNTIINGLP